MPHTMWSGLNRIQLSRCAEYCAQLEFASRGYEIQPDSGGALFLAQNPADGQTYEVRVKSSRNLNYAFIQKDKMELAPHRLVCLLLFEDGKMPDCYLIPSLAWKNPGPLLVSRDFGKAGQTSKPEWGINLSQKNMPLLQMYRADAFFEQA